MKRKYINISIIASSLLHAALLFCMNGFIGLNNFHKKNEDIYVFLEKEVRYVNKNYPDVDNAHYAHNVDKAVDPLIRAASNGNYKSSELSENYEEINDVHNEKNANEAVDPLIRVIPDKYYKSSELSARPLVLINIDQSKLIALFMEKNAPAIIFIFINEHGGVDEVKIENTFYSKEEQIIIRSVFMAMTFEPGKISGINVKSVLKSEVFLENKMDDSSKR